MRERENKEGKAMVVYMDESSFRSMKDHALCRLRMFKNSPSLNRHGGTAEYERIHGDLMQAQLRKDQSEGKQTLRQAAQKAMISRKQIALSPDADFDWFSLPGHCFSALFGGLGVHGYGEMRESDIKRIDSMGLLRVRVRATETVESMASQSKPLTPTKIPHWLVQLMQAVGIRSHMMVDKLLEVCDSGGTCLMNMPDPGGLDSLDLGKSFPFSSFILDYNIDTERGRFLEWMKVQETTRASCQRSVLDLLQGRSCKRSGMSSDVAMDHLLKVKKPRLGAAKLASVPEVVILSDSDT